MQTWQNLMCYVLTDITCPANGIDSEHTLLLVKEQFDQCLYYVLFSRHSAISLSLSLPALVAQLDAPSDWRPGGRGFNPRRGRQHSFVQIDHEIFSTVILSLPLIQEGQLSVSAWRKNVHNTG